MAPANQEVPATGSQGVVEKAATRKEAWAKWRQERYAGISKRNGRPQAKGDRARSITRLTNLLDRVYKQNGPVECQDKAVKEGGQTS